MKIYRVVYRDGVRIISDKMIQDNNKDFLPRAGDRVRIARTEWTVQGVTWDVDDNTVVFQVM